MPEANFEVVERAVAAVNARDLDAYLACCSEDVELRTPAVGGVYEGREGIRRWLADIEDAGPDFRLDVQRLQAIGPNRVLAFLGARSTGRTSGVPVSAEVTNVYDLIDGRLTRIRVFLDRREALQAVNLEASAAGAEE
jgi:ketosteroid isomerase-like protein